MIIDANAGVKPIAMVIKSVYTFIADVAVLGWLWSNHLTSGADVRLIKVFIEFQKWNMLRLLDIAWITEACSEERCHLSKEHNCDGPEADPLVRDEWKHKESQSDVWHTVYYDVEVKGQAWLLLLLHRLLKV